MNEYLLSAMSVYGLPVLFGILVVGCAGVPLPSSLLLIAAGSFVELGDMDQWWVLALATAGAVLGDNIGYGIGRWGGRRLARRYGRWIGGEAMLARAEQWSRRWGGTGIFLSRWLVTPLGPWINLTSGLTGYPWPRFFILDLLGEALWVAIYVTVGRVFGDQVQAMSDVLGDITWVMVLLLVTGMLGWRLAKLLRSAPAPKRDELKPGETMKSAT